MPFKNKNKMELDLPTLIIKFSERNALRYEETLEKANRIVEGGYNYFLPYGIKVEGTNREEREASLKKSLEEKYA